MQPAGHGLWKGGVGETDHESSGDEIDIETIQGWIVQSYKAVAPKKLGKLVDLAAASV